MDTAAYYRQLMALGREDFLAAAAPAVLLRDRARRVDGGSLATTTVTLGREPVETVDARAAHGKVAGIEMELYPLAKKPGASFPDRITIGRTPNNDVVIADPSVSRLHAYVRQVAGWAVADAGSKNGSWLDHARLEPRREAALSAGAVLRIGDVALTFFPSADLFDLLGGDHGLR